MLTSMTDDVRRRTALYTQLRTEWTRQTAQYAHSVRLYQERLGGGRRHRPRALGQYAQPERPLAQRSVRHANLDAPHEGVARPRLELVVPSAPAHADRSPLTTRQREIAELIAQGLTNGQIATRIVVSKGTVGNHIGHMLRRLGVKNRAQIAAWAIRQSSGQTSAGNDRE